MTKSSEGYKAIDAFNKQLAKAYRQYGEKSAIYQKLLATVKGVEIRSGIKVPIGRVSAKTGIFQISKAKNIQTFFMAQDVYREKLRSSQKVGQYTKKVKQYEKLKINYQKKHKAGTDSSSKDIPAFDEMTAYIFANKEAIYGLIGQDDIKQIYNEARTGDITKETFEKVIEIMAESDEISDDTINYFRGL